MLCFAGFGIGQIIQTVEEWKDGFFKQSIPFQNMHLARHLDRVESEAFSYFTHLKSTYPDTWIATSCAVYQGTHGNSKDLTLLTVRLEDLAVKGIPPVPTYDFYIDLLVINQVHLSYASK